MVNVYAPYWLVNKTGILLHWRQKGDADDGPSEVTRAAGDQTPVLFSYPLKTLLSGKKCSVRVGNSDWSSPVGLDAIGHVGVLSVERLQPAGAIAEICVTTRQAYGGLTKVCTFTPRYTLFNNTQRTISCSAVAVARRFLHSSSSSNTHEAKSIEEGEHFSASVTLAPGAQAPFWPTESEAMLKVSFPEENKTHLPFRVDQPQTWPLKTVLVDASRDYDRVVTTDVAIRADQAAVMIHFNPGGLTADLRIENRLSGVNVSYRQADCEGVATRSLQAGHSVLYTRDDVTGPEKLQLVFEGGYTEAVSSSPAHKPQPFSEFGARRIPLSRDRYIWSVCFPDGPQKVLLLCDERDAAAIVRASGVYAPESISSGKAHEPSVPVLSRGVNMHASLALRSICLSLVAPGPLEVAVLSLQDKVSWEFLLPRSNAWGEDWMRFGRANEAALEAAFHARTGASVKVDSDKVVDVASMELVFKNGVRTSVRRHHHPAARATYIDAEECSVVRLVLEHVQIDNQLADPFVPVILAPRLPDRGSEPLLPFLKVLMITGKTADTDARGAVMVERCSVLLQKMSLSVTERFLLRLADLAPASAWEDMDELIPVHKDVALAVEPLYPAERSGIVAATRKQSWRLLELHPIAVDFSFLLTGGISSEAAADDASGTGANDNFIRDFLRAVGVAVSNIDDVPFRMNALILRNCFATQEALVGEIVHHYTMEGIREGLKVLGCLDLIGNPVKLFGHLGDGITDLYYEPLLEGVQSMGAHAVAGAAGFVTSITGTIGNSLAVLSMDEDYQRARKHGSARHRSVAGQLEHGGAQFAQSLYEGATGIFLQPLKGAKAEGAKGFFKGIGKGLIGVVAKPMAGIVDLTTTTVDSLRRLAHDDEHVSRYRLPRCIRPDKVVRIYSAYEAEGAALFHSISLRREQLREHGERYIMHFHLRRKGSRTKVLLLFTNASVLEAYGEDKVKWQAYYEDVTTTRVLKGKGVELAYAEGSGSGAMRIKKRKAIMPAPKPELADFLLETFDTIAHPVSGGAPVRPRR
eukprot:UC1_evm1s1827